MADRHSPSFCFLGKFWKLEIDTVGLEPTTRGFKWPNCRKTLLSEPQAWLVFAFALCSTNWATCRWYKKIRHEVWAKRNPAITDGNNDEPAWVPLDNLKRRLMKCQQQRQSFRRNDEIRTHICSTEWAILLKLRYVSCKVWAKVVCCKLKLLHRQDSFSAARQISVALLTKRSKSTSRLLRRWDDIGLGFSALGRVTWHR